MQIRHKWVVAMIKKRLYLLLSTVLLLVFTVGCHTTDTKREEPFIFTYTFNSMESEDSVMLNQWLSNARYVVMLS